MSSSRTNVRIGLCLPSVPYHHHNHTNTRCLHYSEVNGASQWSQHKTHSHKPPRGEMIPRACHHGSAPRCSRTQRRSGEAALEENHTFLQRVQSLREETAAAAEVSSWPSPTSQDSLLAGTAGATVELLYHNGKCHVHFKTMLQTHLFFWIALSRKLFHLYQKKAGMFSWAFRFLILTIADQLELKCRIHINGGWFFF